MPRVLLVLVPFIAGGLPLSATALGLGEIRLQSALNQPFRAEIPLSADAGDDWRQVNVRLAPAEVFQRFGLDRPAFLGDFSFVVGDGGAGAGLVRISSTRPVAEPFVSLLVEVSWPAGRLLREYTVLLDPPAFASTEAVPARIQAPQAAATPVTPVSRQPEAQADRPGPVVSARPPVDAAAGEPGTLQVRANDTLWGIADRTRADAVSINQMMVALYRANPQAFAGNINRLKAGVILRIPPAAEVAALSPAEATAEVRRQTEDWRGAPPRTAAEPRLQLKPPADEKAPVTPGAAAVGDDRTARLEEELRESRRLVALKNSELQQLQARLAALEGKDATPGQDVAPVAAPSAEGDAPVARLPGEELPTPDAVVGDAAVGESAQAAGGAPPEAAARPVRRPLRPEPVAKSWLQTLGGMVSSTWFLIAAAVALLAGVFVVFSRRRAAGVEDEGTGHFPPISPRGTPSRDAPASSPSPKPAVSPRDTILVEESPAAQSSVRLPALDQSLVTEAREETPLERTISTDAAVELDQSDVVAEAEFHMAYGLYDQAAEILGRALEKSPARRDLRLKLLEVYFIWENKAAFVTEARTYRGQLTDEGGGDWHKVCIMGRQLCPDEVLFAEGAGGGLGSAEADVPLGDDEAGGLDFTFDEGDEAALDVDLTGARPGPDIAVVDPGDLDFGDDTSLMQTAIADAGDGDDAAGRTMETPTIESPWLETPTIETPTIETPAASTVETPTLEREAPDFAATVDSTAEINVEDLGLDLRGLDGIAEELGTDADDPSADDSGVIDIGSIGDEGVDDTSMLGDMSGFDDVVEDEDLADGAMTLPAESDDGEPLDLPAFSSAMEKSAAGSGSDTVEQPRSGAAFDLPHGGDTAEQPAIGDTAEQPGMAADGAWEGGAVDFDIGDALGTDVAGSDDATVYAPPERRGPDGPTLTEVGTKLDLARAYVDMGDPDGARSILNEVIEEGDQSQRQEARKLLDDLAD